jgi:hypothetical protein
MKKEKIRILSNGLLAVYCPGCQCYHGMNINKSKELCWVFNGDYDKPTFSPSILVTIQPDKICHSFIRNGNIQFLTDCAHNLAGQTLELGDEED